MNGELTIWYRNFPAVSTDKRIFGRRVENVSHHLVGVYFLPKGITTFVNLIIKGLVQV